MRWKKKDPFDWQPKFAWFPIAVQDRWILWEPYDEKVVGAIAAPFPCVARRFGNCSKDGHDWIPFSNHPSGTICAVCRSHE